MTCTTRCSTVDGFLVRRHPILKLNPLPDTLICPHAGSSQLQSGLCKAVFLFLIVLLKQDKTGPEGADIPLSIACLLLHLLKLHCLIEKVFSTDIEGTLHGLHLLLDVADLLLKLVRLSLVLSLDLLKVGDPGLGVRRLVGQLLHLLLDAVHPDHLRLLASNSPRT